LEKYSRKLGKILQKIRKNTPQNQDPIVKITFSNYAPGTLESHRLFLMNPGKIRKNTPEN